jgi:flagellar P-ring protein precursor FlgI
MKMLIASIQKEQVVRLTSYLLSLIVGTALLVLALILTSPKAEANTPRIKDIVTFEGIRDNLLVGYGLVVGLNGTGDKLNNSVFTEKSLQSFLGRLGVSTANQELKVKNVAAVTVTAKLPPFARAGSRIDIVVSALGDASSLEGGTLIATPLMAADGEMYAVAQGSVSIGGFSAEGSEGSVTKGIPTTGFISDGAIVEHEIPFELDDLTDVKLALKSPDLTTARLIAERVNEKLGDQFAKAIDPGTVSLMIPLEYTQSVASLLADIEQLTVNTDSKAKIIIDEATGTIVMNDNVKLDTVAVAQGNLVVSIANIQGVSQPGAFAPEGAESVVLSQEQLNVQETQGNIALIKENVKLQDLVNGLNALGVSTRDLITILQTIKQAGALHAEIITR